MANSNMRPAYESTGLDDGLYVETYRSLDDLDESMVRRWRALEDNAVRGNAYMSADFIIPSLRHLTPDADFLIVAVNRMSGENLQTIAIAVFTEVSPKRTRGIRYLSAYRSPHGYLAGPLLHRKYSSEAIQELFVGFFQENRDRWQAVRFACFARTLQITESDAAALAEKSIRWFEVCPENRATLRPNEIGEDFVASTLSKKALKAINRKRRQLQALGHYEWRLVRGVNITEETTQAFLRLEDTGWKKEQNVSLASQESHRRFIAEVMSRFIERDKTFFTEICLDGEIIASTINLLSSRDAFAFKHGWNLTYAKQSIGFLNEIELVNHIPQYLSDIEVFDSGTLPGSFLEKLWTENVELSGGYYSLDRKSAMALWMLKMGVTMKDCVRGFW